MTKKDYELIAGALWRSDRALQLKDKDKVKRAARTEMMRLIATDLCATLANDNPKFDRSRFLKACGIED